MTVVGSGNACADLSREGRGGNRNAFTLAFAGMAGVRIGGG
jgi:hypothetical protein